MGKRNPPPNRSAPQSKQLPSAQAGRLPIAAGFVSVAIALTLAVVLRFWASFDDFWLDEIWSWVLAMQLQSPLDAILRVHHDNNHYINTWVLYAFGKDVPAYLYRLPAVLAGIGTVLLSGLVARRWSRVAAVAATLITGCSFLLIEYSSEARGYAYVLFFAMASFAVIQESLGRPNTIWDILFSCFAILGFLSHLTYLFAYCALVSWSLWHRISLDGWRSRRHVAPLIFQILLPAAFVGFLYFVDLRYMTMGGGDEVPAWQVAVQAISAAFGGPLDGRLTTLVAVTVLLVAAVALYQLYRSGSDLWVPLIIGAFVIPAAILLAGQPPWTYPRYFLVSLLFLQLFMSWFLGWLYPRTYGKIACLLILAPILGGNAVLTTRLLKYGRGDYHAAVQYMLEKTPGQKVLVASDHDFRNKLVLAFYFLRSGNRDRLEYFDLGKWPAEGPEWLLFHNQSQEYTPQASLKDENNNSYSLVRVFPFAGLSGFHWALYHNANRSTDSSQAAEPQAP